MSDYEREAAVEARAQWHVGRVQGLVEAVEAMEQVRQESEREGAGMGVMVALDESVARVKLLLAASLDDARNEGFDIETE